jgi:hypothetical protein
VRSDLCIEFVFSLATWHEVIFCHINQIWWIDPIWRLKIIFFYHKFESFQCFLNIFCGVRNSRIWSKEIISKNLRWRFKLKFKPPAWIFKRFFRQNTRNTIQKIAWIFFKVMIKNLILIRHLGWIHHIWLIWQKVTLCYVVNENTNSMQRSESERKRDLFLHDHTLSWLLLFLLDFWPVFVRWKDISWIFLDLCCNLCFV